MRREEGEDWVVRLERIKWKQEQIEFAVNKDRGRLY